VNVSEIGLPMGFHNLIDLRPRPFKPVTLMLAQRFNL
jgi:hypothetical protein